MHTGQRPTSDAPLGRRGNIALAVCIALVAIVILAEKHGEIERSRDPLHLWRPVLFCLATVLICGPALFWTRRNLLAIERDRRISNNLCRECGYPQYHLPEPRCPECGSRLGPISPGRN